MKHIKLFKTESNYNNWLNSDKFVTPYISKNKYNNSIIYQPRIKYYDSQIEYLESTGTQHIDTNLICYGNYRFKIKFMCNSLVSPEDNVSASLFGTRWAAHIRNYQLSTYHGGCFGFKDIHEGVGINEINTEYVVEFNNDNELYVNNVQKLNNINESFDTPSSLLLFALHEQNNITEHFIGRIYYFTLYNKDNNETLLDLIPVRKNGIGYMYDKLTHNLYGESSGSNTPFILGPDI